MKGRRYTASNITDDALDALYENANEGWRRGDRWKERAIAAEAERDRLAAAARLLLQDAAAEIRRGPWSPTVDLDTVDVIADHIGGPTALTEGDVREILHGRRTPRPRSREQ